MPPARQIANGRSAEALRRIAEASSQVNFESGAVNFAPCSSRSLPSLALATSLHVADAVLTGLQPGRFLDAAPLRQLGYRFCKHSRMPVNVRLRRLRAHQRHVVKRRQQHSPIQRIQVQEAFQFEV
jgi:hypothetical protein